LLVEVDAQPTIQRVFRNLLRVVGARKQ
jgi:hypothetical protein